MLYVSSNTLIIIENNLMYLYQENYFVDTGCSSCSKYDIGYASNLCGGNSLTILRLMLLVFFIQKRNARQKYVMAGKVYYMNGI